MKEKLSLLEQKALKAMMNPHFIFNVINAIQSFINSGDKEAANNYLSDFAKLIRISSKFSEKSIVLLDEELDYLNLYLSFEKLRFGEHLRYEIIIDPTVDLQKTSIPVMIIQPILENAIWHGILPLNAEGNLKLIINRMSEFLLKIIVEDNGVGITDLFISENLLKQCNDSHMLCIAIQRLKLLSESSHQEIYFRYKHLHPDQKNKGTIAEFLLPALFE